MTKTTVTAKTLLKSAYEIARDLNIQENQNILKNLGLIFNQNDKNRLHIDNDVKKNVKKKTKRKKVSNNHLPKRQSKRIRGIKADTDNKEEKVMTKEDQATLLKRIEATEEARKRKYERLIKKHLEDGLQLPKNATYQHTVHRVTTMNEKALLRRIKTIERACGTYAVIKMRQFAEVLILEEYHTLAKEAEAALERLLLLPKYHMFRNGQEKA